MNPPLNARSPAPSCRLRKPKASRPAVTGLLAKDNVSLPVASPVPLSRRDETKKAECLSRPSCRPPSPAEIKRPLTLPGKISSLSLKTPDGTRASEDVLRGAARGAPVTRSCWGGVLVAQYRDSLSCRSSAAGATQRSVTVARGSAERVAKRSGYSGAIGADL